MVAMPEPDRAVLGRRDRIVKALSAIVPGEGVIASEAAMRPYETDGLTAYRCLPMVVVLPSTTEQVSRILAYCHGEGIKVVPRGPVPHYRAARCLWPTAFSSAWPSSTVSARSTTTTASW